MKKFSKNKEDFICENCGTKNIGNGWTNHCHNCLYSKHVDINPGDRQCKCNGLMKPIEILQKNGNFIVLHKCTKCGFERKNKLTENDNFEEILKISKTKK